MRVVSDVKAAPVAMHNFLRKKRKLAKGNRNNENKKLTNCQFPERSIVSGRSELSVLKPPSIHRKLEIQRQAGSFRVYQRME